MPGPAIVLNHHLAMIALMVRPAVLSSTTAHRAKGDMLGLSSTCGHAMVVSGPSRAFEGRHRQDADLAFRRVEKS
jgi:hypothetical protein